MPRCLCVPPHALGAINSDNINIDYNLVFFGGWAQASRTFFFVLGRTQRESQALESIILPRQSLDQVCLLNYCTADCADVECPTNLINSRRMYTWPQKRRRHPEVRCDMLEHTSILCLHAFRPNESNPPMAEDSLRTTRLVASILRANITAQISLH